MKNDRNTNSPPQPKDERIPNAGPQSPYILRRRDQLTVAAWLSVALIAIGWWWIAQGGLTGRVIELDRAPPLQAQFQVDINRADWPELVQLPGVGETLAMRIIESRRTEGPFRDHDDLRRVSGIGPKTLEGLRPHLLPMPKDEAMAETPGPTDAHDG